MSEKLGLKTPVTYYGGKQCLAGAINKMIPAHAVYCEPFAGGAAVFFRKKPCKVEILNDTNKELMNFYEVVKNNFEELNKKVQTTLYSRDLFRQASVIYNNSDMFSSIDRAWALWVLSYQSYHSIIESAWGYETEGRSVSRTFNKKNQFKDLIGRLDNCVLECADANYIIKAYDRIKTFFYVDPPYYNSNMGHYDGYSLEDYTELLETLSKIKGKFLLSSYPSEILDKYISEQGWITKTHETSLFTSKTRKKKVEVFTANYDFNYIHEDNKQLKII